MSTNRGRHRRNQSFFCPECDRRLWRLGSPKHFLFYSGATEIKQNTHLTHKKAALLATQGSYVDRNTWIEEFFCGEDGRMWLVIHADPEGVCTTKVAQDHDWKRSTGTIDPDMPNSSVSEFTYRMSRGASPRLP